MKKSSLPRGFVRPLVAVAAILTAVALPSVAHAQEDDTESVAMRANKGLKIGLGPTILMPQRDGGPLGGGLTLDGRYGIKAGPTVLAPGGRLSGYLQSARFTGIAMPTFRITLPAGPLAPYIVGGVGGGWISNPSDSGLAVMGGGGLMIHFGRFFAIGAEATYQRITTTPFEVLAIGPSISFGG